jgi:hypothetical protein
MKASLFPANASVLANASLAVELTMGIALGCGAWLARRGRYRAHAWCQASVVMLNGLIIAGAMIPSLHALVLPKLSTRLGHSFYLVATLHGALGLFAEIAGIYVLVAAGTEWLPPRWQLRKFRLVMRAVLVLWWLALASGVATYFRWYLR